MFVSENIAFTVILFSSYKNKLICNLICWLWWRKSCKEYLLCFFRHKKTWTI